MRPKLSATAVTLALTLLATGIAFAQVPEAIKKPGAPVNLNPGQKKQPQEAKPVELTPLVFSQPLPTKPVAWVNGTVITQEQLLKKTLEQNFSGAVQVLLMSRICDRELTDRKVELTEDEIMDELKEMLGQQAGGVSIEAVTQDGKFSAKYLRLQARTMRGWKKIFWEAQKIPEDQRHGQTGKLLLQFYITQAMQKYERRMRGMNPPPTPGYVGEAKHLESGNQILVEASEALDYVMGMVMQGSLLKTRDDLVDSDLLRAELDRMKVTVTEQEVADWAAHQRATHTPPFTWEQICKLKGTTPDREMERWRRIQAWKRINKIDPSESELMAFLEENRDFFKGKIKKVSHVLVRTVDETTGLALDEDALTTAKAKIDTIYKKVMEGVDFGWIAENYSDDRVTAKGKGRLAAPVKKWGTSLDPSFRDAAWGLDAVGDISKPIKSQFGWHVIKLDEVTNPAKPDPNWKEERYLKWIRDEYETIQMNKYLDGLRNKAKIKLAPSQELFELKHKSFYTSPDKR